MKQYVWGITAVVLAMMLSAFMKEKEQPVANQVVGLPTTYYYKYSGSDFSMSGYMNSGNWTARGFNPGSDDCPFGADQVPCVIFAQTGGTSVTYLMSFFNDIGAANVVDYVENPMHVYYYRPEP